MFAPPLLALALLAGLFTNLIAAVPFDPELMKTIGSYPCTAEGIALEAVKTSNQTLSMRTY